MPQEICLVNLLVDQERHTALKQLLSSLPDITLNLRQICDFELLTTGVFSPLKGFMTREAYESVLDRMRLPSGEIWPVPICLDVSRDLADRFEAGQSAVLRDPEGFPLGLMAIEDIWQADMEKEAMAVYGTTDMAHDEVARLQSGRDRYYVGGTIEALNLPIHSDFKQIRNTPSEVRQQFVKLGWKRVVGFQTRQPIHRPQFELTIQAMKKAKANLLMLPIAGIPRPGDFDHYTRMRCYQKVAAHYPPDTHMLNLLPLSTRLAGPRDAVLHMIVGKNFGCTHFVIGHNHATPGKDSCGNSFYDTPQVRELARQAGEEIGIEPVFFEEMVYLPFEDEFKLASEVKEGQETLSFTNDHIRDRVRKGKNIPEWASFPDVIKELRRSYPSPVCQGFTVFLTGLSGAGKSTIANVLYSKFMEIGTRPVTLLDGDIVRRNLSSELNFSKEHRDINVRRIGFVASEITKNRGIAICAPIAPYERTRSKIRESIEAHGGFFEIHVATPISVCEKRDRKGMYAKAKAGLLKGFTGVDDPYEEPSNPELSIDTSNLTPDEAVQQILLLISEKGFV
ncbi:bifunctional sulfate adenylyltransferase/adenylylsulfate kinase [uncultured Desulfobacter sp.]|uniref:bifunctional sulfate adenylyltransferase/adenylylsulfate kinase n=1 Tax=uncultured Desulfobacter sp. TaxID=240139 RepID=UPI002AAC4041|nr:bifunctional sulfate adenylyltransferase/adenylylsulfate kinase [uncultured Desulfobacter sp.]